MSLVRTVQAVLLPITCLLFGACLSIFMWGRSSDERAFLSKQLQEYQSLETEQKNNVRKSYAMLKSMPARKQTEIEQIHQQTRANPELLQTMNRYFEWWSSLSQAEWDSFEELSAEVPLQNLLNHTASRLLHNVSLNYFISKNLALTYCVVIECYRLS